MFTKDDLKVTLRCYTPIVEFYKLKDFLVHQYNALIDLLLLSIALLFRLVIWCTFPVSFVVLLSLSRKDRVVTKQKREQAVKKMIDRLRNES